MEPLAVVVGDSHETPHQTGTTRFSYVRCEKAKRGCASRVPASAGAPHETGDGGESDPNFSALVRHRGGLAISPHSSRLTSPWTVTLTTVIPGGKAEMAKTQSRVVLLNQALVAASL